VVERKTTVPTTKNMRDRRVVRYAINPRAHRATYIESREAPPKGNVDFLPKIEAVFWPSLIGSYKPAQSRIMSKLELTAVNRPFHSSTQRKIVFLTVDGEMTMFRQLRTSLFLLLKIENGFATRFGVLKNRVN